MKYICIFMDYRNIIIILRYFKALVRKHFERRIETEVTFFIFED